MVGPYAAFKRTMQINSPIFMRHTAIILTPHPEKTSSFLTRATKKARRSGQEALLERRSSSLTRRIWELSKGIRASSSMTV